jgi:hypothetical protein
MINPHHGIRTSLPTLSIMAINSVLPNYARFAPKNCRSGTFRCSPAQSPNGTAWFREPGKVLLDERGRVLATWRQCEGADLGEYGSREHSQLVVGLP